MDILLHICCGPCAIYPITWLKNKKFKVKGFYYNPNIYPVQEYSRRKDALGIVSAYLKFEYVCPEYQPEDYFFAISSKECLPDRCAVCFSLRLKKAAQHALDYGFKIFSTTLLASPYQDHALLKVIGRKVAKDVGLDFYYEDFRLGFKQAQNEARDKGIYRQKYCGCKFSIKNEKQTKA